MKGIVTSNIKDLAQGIYESLKPLNNKYILRPFNRFNVEKSMWWIIPSKEFPAYKYGKYMVGKKEDGTYVCGIHIEKGLEKSAKYKEKEILDNSWVWHDLIRAVEQGEIGRVLNHINTKTDSTVGIEIQIDIPDMQISRKLRLKNDEFIDSETGLVVELKNIPSWLCQIEGIEWYWVDFFIVFGFQALDDDTEQAWTEEAIVKNVLEPLVNWIR